MHDQQAPANLPLGTPESAMRRGSRTVEWEWNGQRWTAKVRALTWGIEKQVVSTTTDAKGFDPGAFVDTMLGALVEESNAPLVGPQRLGCDPELVWSAARALGVLKHLRTLGMKLLSDDSMRMTVQDVVREYRMVELRLRSAGYTVEELEKIPADDVRDLFVADDASRTMETERQAIIIGNIIAQRLGV